jgi:hypothetical protein
MLVGPSLTFGGDVEVLKGDAWIFHHLDASFLSC